MPIVYRDADLFATGCEALVNPVNCVGVMGRGLALAFKRRYPAHFASYRRACRAGDLRPGAVHVDDLGAGACPRFLVALPTKRHWRDPARLDDIERSVRAFAEALREHRVASVAIPKLGCGLGGLAWPDVHHAIAPVLAPVAATGCRIVLLAPRPPSPGRARTRRETVPYRTAATQRGAHHEPHHLQAHRAARIAHLPGRRPRRRRLSHRTTSSTRVSGLLRRAPR